MRWHNITEIAEALEENHCDVDIDNLKLNKLHKWVVSLLDFDDDPTATNEIILESVKNEWERIRGYDLQ